MSIELESAARLAALRDKANATTGEATDTLAGAVDALIAGYGQGGGGEDVAQYMTFYNGNAFRSAVYPDNYHVILRINGNTTDVSLSNLMAYSNMTKATFKVYNIPSTGITASSNMFGGCFNLTVINFENVPFVTKNAISMFSDCVVLETINGILDVSGCTNLNTTFSKNYLLKDVRFANESIKVKINFANSQHLTGESTQSIIDGLADLTGGTAQTITLNENVKAKLTEDQISTITGKNWTLA